MMARMFIPVILPVLLALPMTLQAQFNFMTNNGSILITGYTGPGGAVTIPDEINGLPVTGIDAYAFMNHFNVTSVSIPESVTTIGFGAFYYCSGLSSITIPASVATIGGQAFYYCENLTNITLSSGLRSLEAGVFFYCTSLTGVSIPNSVTNIGESAFFGCFSLPSISIPDGVQSIGYGSFDLCKSLTNVSIPSSVSQIAGNSFYACSALEAFVVDAQNPFYTTKDGILFSKDLSLLVACPAGRSGSYAIPAGVRNIGEFAFAVCRNITNLCLPNSVTNLDYWSFSQCESITRITIPKSIRYIDDFAFQDCTLLREVYFQGDAPGVSGFGARVFFGDQVNLYYLPATTGWDEFFAFLNCSGTLWNPTVSIDDENIGGGTNRFILNITGTTDIPFVLEAATNLSGSAWIPLESGILTNGSVYFTDLESANYPQRFYRVCSP